MSSAVSKSCWMHDQFPTPLFSSSISSSESPNLDPETARTSLDAQITPGERISKVAEKTLSEVGTHLQKPQFATALTILCELNRENNIPSPALDILKFGQTDQKKYPEVQSPNQQCLSQKNSTSRNENDHESSKEPYSFLSSFADAARKLIYVFPTQIGWDRSSEKKVIEESPWSLIENENLISPLTDTLQNLDFFGSLATKFISLINTGDKLSLSHSFETFFRLENLKQGLKSKDSSTPIIFLPFDDRIVILNNITEDLEKISFYDPKVQGTITLDHITFLNLWTENKWRNTECWKSMEWCRKALVFKVPQIDEHTISFHSNSSGWMKNFIHQIYLNGSFESLSRNNICTTLDEEIIPFELIPLKTEKDFEETFAKINPKEQIGYVLKNENELFLVERNSKLEDLSITSFTSKFPFKLPYLFHENSSPPKALILSLGSINTSKTLKLQRVALKSVIAANREKELLASWEESGKSHRREDGNYQGDLLNLKTVDEMKNALANDSSKCLIVPFSPSWIVVTAISDDSKKVLYLTPDHEWGMHLVEEKSDLFIEKLIDARCKFPEKMRHWVRRLTNGE